MARSKPAPSTRAGGKPRPLRLHKDGWENAMTGLGVLGKDKRLGSVFRAELITYQEAEEVWRGDDISARIVEKIPDEMLREGFEVCVQEEQQPADKPLGKLAAFEKGLKGLKGEEEGEEAPATSPFAEGAPGETEKADDAHARGGEDTEPIDPSAEPAPDDELPEADEDENGEPEEAQADNSKDLGKLIAEEHRRLDTTEKLRKALQFQRAFGGGGILMGINDGGQLEDPVDEKSIQSVDFLTVFTARELQPNEYYGDVTREKYGEIKNYRLVPYDTPPGANASLLPVVHASRLLIFQGTEVSRSATLRNTIPGWGDSIFVRTLQVINDFQAGWQGVGGLLTDFTVPTLKIAGLAKVLATAKGSSATEGLATRAKAFAAAISMARVAIVDAEEDYSRESTTVTGLPDLLDKWMLRLAAAAEMPVSLLMGQAPSGLNATGDSDIRWFYDQVAARQTRVLLPSLWRLTKLLLLAKKGPAKGKEPKSWDVKFHPLWQQTESEQATARKTQAEADAIYIEAQVVTPQEIARSRFGGDGYSTETVINHDLRDEMANVDDEKVHLGAGAAEDKAKEFELKKEQAKKPPVAGASPFGAKGGKPGAAPSGKTPFPPKA